ncbi:Protein of unknown function [Bacillus wiedmannii]|uniref:Uncharacterized protein n=2 Tax=Bacillus cereus group TaxID=86661 RepID=A0A1C4AJR5_BACTU|nr:Protein of unknown function [Bacillus wiedmannii]SCB94922.1 Protein of unknown function [Bacillus thuringiensis]
MLLAVLADY